MKHDHPVLSLSISPDVRSVAIGMAEGTFCLRRQHVKDDQLLIVKKASTTTAAHNWQFRASSYRYFLRGKCEKTTEMETLITGQKKIHFRAYVQHLKRCAYKDALDAALASRAPKLVMAVLEDLSGKGVLEMAITDRKAVSVAPLLDFLNEYIAYPQFTKTILHVTNLLLNLYGGLLNRDFQIKKKIHSIIEHLKLEVSLQEDLMEVHGILEPILVTFLTQNYLKQKKAS